MNVALEIGGCSGAVVVVVVVYPNHAGHKAAGRTGKTERGRVNIFFSLAGLHLGWFV